MKGCRYMGAGLKLVKEAIAVQFNVKDLDQIPGNGTADSVFVFNAEDRRFWVYVSQEWDDAPKHFKVDLSPLGKKLRASKNGKARVARDGILRQ
jgi:hypothetical protein